MNILITGASSKIGKKIIQSWIADHQIFAISRSSQKLKDIQSLVLNNQLHSGELFLINEDLNNSLEFIERLDSIDLCLHLAAITHTHEEADYFRINHDLTLNLGKKLLAKFPNIHFAFMSSQVAGREAGSYALSKWSAEKDLLKLKFKKLTLLRPSEVVGLESNEGIDKLIFISKKTHLHPWFIGSNKINYAPLDQKALLFACSSILLDDKSTPSSAIYLLKGRNISTTELAFFLLKKYIILPVPIFIPLLMLADKIFRSINIRFFSPDQIDRLTGKRNQIPGDVELIDFFEVNPEHQKFDFKSHLDCTLRPKIVNRIISF